MNKKIVLSGKIELYHGNDHILNKPLYNFGSPDNDYGQGFYTTLLFDKAKDWALSFGGDGAIVNKYKINLDNLNVLNLDNYGILTWIAEIVYNRGARGESGAIMGKELIKKYKINFEEDNGPDIIVGYRADDSYTDIIDAFLNNKLNIEEVERLFREGDLGYQYFIKSEKAFDSLEWNGYEDVKGYDISPSEMYARNKVSSFLRQRESAMLLNGYKPNGLTALSVINNFYEYDNEWNYYSLSNDYDNINEYIEGHNSKKLGE